MLQRTNSATPPIPHAIAGYAPASNVLVVKAAIAAVVIAVVVAIAK